MIAVAMRRFHSAGPGWLSGVSAASTRTCIELIVTIVPLGVFARREAAEPPERREALAHITEADAGLIAPRPRTRAGISDRHAQPPADDIGGNRDRTLPVSARGHA
jgi:hypothetical protein